MILAGVARSSFYGRQAPREESEEDLLRCHLIDEQYTRRPFYGSRRMVVYLADQRQHGPVVLRRLSGGCVGRARQARDLQHRSGSQFTSAAFTGVLQREEIAISMDGRGRALDTISSSNGCGAASSMRTCI